MKKREGDDINLTNRWSLIKEDIVFLEVYVKQRSSEIN